LADAGVHDFAIILGYIMPGWHCVRGTMLAFILAGSAALIAVLSASALLLFAQLTGKVRRSSALALAVMAMAAGAGLAAAGTTEGFLLGPLAVPVGVFLMLAAAVNGFVMLASPNGAARARNS
jgi:hypothetical protein